MSLPQQDRRVARAAAQRQFSLWQNRRSWRWRSELAHQLLTETLESSGFSVTRHFVLDTGFKAEFGLLAPGAQHRVMCEFDALRASGNACGHNLIAEVGWCRSGIKGGHGGGGVAGRSHRARTPAEEAQGGKINMINAGFFKDVDVALMAQSRDRMTTVIFTGKASHAAGSRQGRASTPLDAAVTAYQSVSNLGSRCGRTGGCTHQYCTRASTGGDSATAAQQMRNLRALGVEHTQLYPGAHGSTDMGNVSYEVPSIHPMFFIGGDTCHAHSAGFAVAGPELLRRSVTSWSRPRLWR
uniref:Amidohydrolase family protein n=1 Tax=Macrostomum lignano TaxID=282301 RepID=A0A1I8F9R9_9PLAT